MLSAGKVTKMRKIVTALLGILVLFVVVAVVGFARSGGTKHVTLSDIPPLPAAVTIQGHVTVPAGISSQNFEGGDCTSAAGYDDIAAGAEIAVTSPSGVVLKTGQLNGGHTSTLFADDGSIIGGTADECSYHFLIEGVNGSLELYGVSVGTAVRGTIHYTHDQVGQPVEIRIGS